MVNSVRSLLACLVAVILGGNAVAQPPEYFRWSGSTAVAPVQGNFNQGTPLTLTWGFMATGTPINDSVNSGYANAPNNLPARLNAIYSGGQAQWQPIFAGVFDRWASVSGLSYQYEPMDDGAALGGQFLSDFPSGQLGTRADVRIGGKPLNGNGGVLAYDFYPTIGDMVIDTNDNFYSDTSGSSIRLRNVISHEHGHGIGMPHIESNNASFLMQPFLNTAFDGPQYHDVLAAQHMYGDVREKSNGGLGNDTVARATPLGNVSAAPVSVGNSARTLAVAPVAVDFLSIDSATDTDVFSFTIDSGGTISASLEALGFNYRITPQGSGGNVAFDSKSRSDLSLQLLGADGATILLTVNETGLGGDESLAFFLSAAGTYFLRVNGIDNADAIALDTQFYGLSLSFVPVPEPASAFLFATVGLAGGVRAARRWDRGAA